MDLTGKVIAIMEARSGVSNRTGNTWMTQEYVIEVPGQYPRKMMFNIFGEDRIKQFNIQAGEEITVQFDIDAREFNGRWYTSIRAYRIVQGDVTQPAAPAAAPAAPTAPTAPAAPVAPAEQAPVNVDPFDATAGDGTSDLPF